MTNGYNFYVKYGSAVLTFPITPSELSIDVGSNNKVVNLISEGDINILKSPALTKVEFTARFPMRQYPYARKFDKFENYWNIFKELKEKKEPFRFIVTRTTPTGSRTWDTNLLVALEDIKIKESADDGDDVLVSFSLKQYKEYGVKKLKTTTTTTTTPTRPKDTTKKKDKTHKIKSGDTLWSIAKKYYGNGSKWKTIYTKNKTVIENAAKKRGKKSSSNGKWIYPGTVLTIPAL